VVVVVGASVVVVVVIIGAAVVVVVVGAAVVVVVVGVAVVVVVVGAAVVVVVVLVVVVVGGTTLTNFIFPQPSAKFSRYILLTSSDTIIFTPDNNDALVALLGEAATRLLSLIVL
jgi:hypothetical protein